MNAIEKTIGEKYDVSGQSPLSYSEGVHLVEDFNSLFYDRRIQYTGEHNTLVQIFFNETHNRRLEMIQNNADITEQMYEVIKQDKCLFVNPGSLEFSEVRAVGHSEVISYHSLLCCCDSLAYTKLMTKSYGVAYKALHEQLTDKTMLPDILGYDPDEVDMDQVADNIQPPAENNPCDMEAVKDDIFDSKLIKKLYPVTLQYIRNQI